jgi:hypothetical protein
MQLVHCDTKLSTSDGSDVVIITSKETVDVTLPSLSDDCVSGITKTRELCISAVNSSAKHKIKARSGNCINGKHQTVYELRGGNSVRLFYRGNCWYTC